MSGLLGCLRLDGRPLDGPALEAMAAALGHRGPVVRWSDDRVALVVLADPGGASGLGQAADGAVRVALDGRLDDRAGLLAALGPDRPRAADAPDAELLARAHVRWGTAGLARATGSWAAALWDARSGRLVLARDRQGVRPLVAHHGGGALRWASEVAGVLADPAVPRRPDPVTVAERLTSTFRSVDRTLWAGVVRVPPGHLLDAGPSGIARRAFWCWRPTEDRPGDDRAAADAVRGALDRAVGDVLAEGHPVGLQLSGGLDSSTVVGVAADLVARHGGPPLHVATLAFPGRPFDEAGPVAAVAAATGLAVVRHEPPATLGRSWYEAEGTASLDLPPDPTIAMHEPLLAGFAAAGAPVVVTGHGGDEWFGGSRLALAEDLRRGRLGSAVRRLRDDAPFWPARSPLHRLVRDGLAPALPGVAHRGRPDRRWASAAPWLGPALVDDAGLEAWRMPPTPRGPAPAEAEVAAKLLDGRRLHVLEELERHVARRGLDLRAPLEDRRVVDVALALPDDLRRHRGVTRWALRLAGAGVVPDEVRTRGDKARFLDRLLDELAAAGGADRFGDLALADLGWVDPALAQATYRAVAESHGYGRFDHRLSPLWFLHCTDLWFRTTVHHWQCQ